MARFLTAFLLLIVAIALVAGGMSYLSYGVEHPPSAAQIEGLRDSATVVLHSDLSLPVKIITGSDLDSYRALGYAQAQEMAWTLLLWRQLAHGRLGAWLGSDALPLDRHAARLGFARENSALFQALSERDRQALEAFAQGVSTGLQDAHRRDRIVALLGIKSEPYRVEDVLAVERLFAWCTTSLTWPDSTELSDEAREFVRQDSLFRHALGLFGWPESAGWTYRDSSRTVLTARWVTGNSVLPIIHESLVYTRADSTLMLTIPGTPFALLNVGTNAAAVFPRGRAVLKPTVSRAWTRDAVALRGPNSATFVEPFWRSAEAVLLAPDTTARNAWEINWPGLQPRTDAAAWMRLRRGDPSALTFSLIDASVLTTRPESSSQEDFATYTRGHVTAPAAYLPWLQRRLDSLSVSHAESVLQWFSDAQSTWAVSVNEDFTARLDSSLLRVPHHRTAYEYLTNWSGDFDGASIGATVYEAYARAMGVSPRADQATPPDTTQFFATLRYTQMLAQVADTLQHHYGPDPLDWRWEQAHPERRMFPLWSVAETLGLDVPRLTAFRSFTLPGEGHTTTLRWLDTTNQGADATFVAVIETGARPSWHLYRLQFDPTQAFARYRVAGRRLQLQPIVYPPDSGHLISLSPTR